MKTIYNQKRICFRPKPELIPALDRLMRQGVTTIDCKLAQSLGRIKEISYVRNNKELDGYFYIAGPDNKKHESILFLKKPMQLKRDKKNKNSFYLIF